MIALDPGPKWMGDSRCGSVGPTRDRWTGRWSWPV